MPNRRKLWFDTVVLSNFLFADSLPWLIDRYQGRILVTSAVLDEIAQGIACGYGELNAAYSYLGPKKIVHYSLTPKELKKIAYFRRYLGAGEASCLACALSRGGIVVTDDRKARAACKENNIQYTGTVGILSAAATGGSLSADEADAMLERMKKHGFYSPVSSIKDIV